MTYRAKPRILVLGGGFGGLETAFYLRERLPDQAEITLVSDRNYFLFKPSLIYVPFGLNPERLKVPLAEPARRKDILFVQARVREIDPETKTVLVDQGKLHYDYLVVATGARMRPRYVPGLNIYGHSISTPAEMIYLRDALRELVERAKNGQHQQILFLVPPGNKFTGPMYELVFMLDTWLRRKRLRDNVGLVWTTYEDTYVQAFGPRMHEVAAHEFTRRGIPNLTHCAVEQVEKDGALFQDGRSVEYNLLIGFPPYIASTRFDELPMDERGFIATDEATRQVTGHPDIYAVGDASDFPVKQAFLALLQADTVGEHLTSTILGKEPKTVFTPISHYLMEQFNQATYAQVPLQTDDDAERHVEVRADVPELYRVGTSPAWRLGKKMLGVILPQSYLAGEPFLTSMTWRSMEAGLGVMSAALAK